ncbi:hypothetical protein P152DRAFT_463147, partial [Eremomyces bilateralis CBS 781.70]
KSDRLRKKKLSPLHHRFTVLEAIGGSAYRLDTPGERYNVFHESLLRPTLDNPFPT